MCRALGAILLYQRMAIQKYKTPDCQSIYQCPQCFPVNVFFNQAVFIFNVLVAIPIVHSDALRWYQFSPDLSVPSYPKATVSPPIGHGASGQSLPHAFPDPP